MTEAGDDDSEVRARMVRVKPELDPVLRSVFRANAAAALFGTRTAVTVGRYQLLREVGTGGGGSVFVARDPDLDRDIAIKLIVAESDELRARALSEGQALAGLSHPNIVPVFDVGVVDERVYLVMELIRGESLRSYASSAHVRDIVGAYRQAGEGLAAAHAAGLVHRDFKPDNAVIGDDRRVRVIDFGLARAATDEPVHGIAGTPRYMAPEQRAGQPATAATDQYAFAISLREAVGDAPPRWLDAILVRAAADDPARRFPSMAALLAALADDPRRRWRRRLLIATPVTFAIAGFALGRGGEDSVAPCDGRAEVASAWSAQRTAAAQTHVASFATPFAAVSAPRARAALDAYATAWITSYNATCAASRRNAPLADRRAACLSQARSHLREAVDLVAGITLEGLPSAMTAISELPDLERCADDAALVDNVPPPANTERDATRAIAADLDRVQVAINAARPDSVTRAQDAVARARSLGYRPLLARALLATGRAELATGQRSRSIAPLAEATEVALSVGDNATAVEAFARAAWAKLATGSEPAAAMQGLDLLVALAQQLGPRDHFARALLHNNAGTIENAAGNTERARAHLTTALALARDIEGPGSLELSAVRSNLALVTTDAAERERLVTERVTILRERLGDEHPLTLNARIAVAFAIPDDDRARESLRPACETYARMHPAHGAAIVECASELIWLQLATGDSAGARASAALALAANPDRVDVERVHLMRGYAALLDGKPAAARERLDAVAARILPASDTKWWQLLFAAEVDLARALVARAEGKPARAILERARGYLERAAAAKPLPTITRRLEWLRRATE